MQFLFSGKTSVLTKLRFSCTAVPARSANPLQPAGVLPCQSDASKKKKEKAKQELIPSPECFINTVPQLM